MNKKSIAFFIFNCKVRDFAVAYWVQNRLRKGPLAVGLLHNKIIWFYQVS